MPIKMSFEIIWVPLASSIMIYTIFAIIGKIYPTMYRLNKDIMNEKGLYEKIFIEKYNWICFFIALFEVWMKFKGSSIFII
jgi:hypothetical protein